MEISQKNDLLKAASAEIKDLRRQNDLMKARLNMFDDMMLLIRTSPTYPSQGYSEDLAWAIDNHLHELKP